MRVELFQLLTGFIAASIVILDMIQGINIPLRLIRKLRAAYLWILVFVSINFFLSTVLHELLFENQVFVENVSSEIVRSLILGIFYAFLAESKLGAIKLAGRKEFPIGISLLYNYLKNISYEKINFEVLKLKREEAKERARKTTLQSLARDARFIILNNSLYSSEDREKLKLWLNAVLTDADAAKEDKMLVLANFINCGDSSHNYFPPKAREKGALKERSH